MFSVKWGEIIARMELYQIKWQICGDILPQIKAKVRGSLYIPPAPQCLQSHYRAEQNGRKSCACSASGVGVLPARHM